MGKDRRLARLGTSNHSLRCISACTMLTNGRNQPADGVSPEDGYDGSTGFECRA